MHVFFTSKHDNALHEWPVKEGVTVEVPCPAGWGGGHLHVRVTAEGITVTKSDCGEKVLDNTFAGILQENHLLKAQGTLAIIAGAPVGR